MNQCANCGRLKARDVPCIFCNTYVSFSGVDIGVPLEDINNALSNIQEDDMKAKKPTIKHGEYIKSDRAFGVEMELNMDNEKIDYINNKREGFYIEHDGSVDLGAEIVTEVLEGKEGENIIKHLCEVVNKAKVTADESCSLHVHLDAKDYIGKSEISVMPFGEVLSNKIEDNFTVIQPSVKFEKPKHWVIDKGLDNYNLGTCIARYNNFRVFFAPDYTSRCMRLPSCEKINKDGSVDKTCINHTNGSIMLSKQSLDYPCIISSDSARRNNKLVLSRLKRLSAFLVAFDDVMLSFVAGHRRENDYANRISSLLSLKAIDRCKSFRDFFSILFIEDDLNKLLGALNQQRHPSRFYGINFTALFKHGTIENRYHHGTTKFEDVINWVILNQTILDRCADVENPKFDIPRIIKASNLLDKSYKTDLFFKKLALPTETEMFYREKIEQYKYDDRDLGSYLLDREVENK